MTDANTRGRPTKPTPEEIAQVRAMSAQGCSAKDIAIHLRRPKPTIQRWRERYQIGVTPKPRRPPVRTTDIVPTSMTAFEIAQTKSLRAAGWTYHAIGGRLDRNPVTVRRLCEEPRMAEEIALLQEDMASFFDGLARRMIESISDEDIMKISAYQRTIAAAVSLDKLRLLRNQSTSNISLHVIVEQLEREERAQRGERQNHQQQDNAPLPRD